MRKKQEVIRLGEGSVGVIIWPYGYSIHVAEEDAVMSFSDL